MSLTIDTRADLPALDSQNMFSLALRSKPQAAAPSTASQPTLPDNLFAHAPIWVRPQELGFNHSLKRTYLIANVGSENKGNVQIQRLKGPNIDPHPILSFRSEGEAAAYLMKELKKLEEQGIDVSAKNLTKAEEADVYAIIHDLPEDWTLINKNEIPS